MRTHRERGGVITGFLTLTEGNRFCLFPSAICLGVGLFWRWGWWLKIQTIKLNLKYSYNHWVIWYQPCNLPQALDLKGWKKVSFPRDKWLGVPVAGLTVSLISLVPVTHNIKWLEQQEEKKFKAYTVDFKNKLCQECSEQSQPSCLYQNGKQIHNFCKYNIFSCNSQSQ